jgi:hypothetical protein
MPLLKNAQSELQVMNGLRRNRNSIGVVEPVLLKFALWPSLVKIVLNLYNLVNVR